MMVWRIHIKNDVCDGYTRNDLLSFCRDKKLIGVGWGDIKTREDSESEIRKEAQSYRNATAGIKAVNTMRKMRIDDLIWTRLDGIYYLCRVTELWKNSKPETMHYKLDIPNYVNVEWLEIGLEQDVPGKVVSSFRPAASAQAITGVEDISQYLWNQYAKEEYYTLAKNKMDIWSVLSAESIEELVLLYLQAEKGYHVYSTTMKYAFREYECFMVKKDGTHAYPQVKTGSVILNADDYMDALKYDKKATIYLFSTSEKYVKNGCDDIQFLYKQEIERFIRENRCMLPALTQSWIDLCGFF